MGFGSRRFVGACALAAAATLSLAVPVAMAGPTAPPTISIAFASATSPVNGTTALSFTIDNPNSSLALTGVAFSGTLPVSLAVATPNGLTGSCGGGTIDASGQSISLASASLAASSSCTFSVDIVAISPGLQTFTAGAVTSNETGPGQGTSTSITVGRAPTVGLSFNPSWVDLGGTSTLTVSLYNPEVASDDLAGLSVTVTLPADLTVADASDNACDTGSWTASGGHTIAFTGGSLPVGWSCSFSVEVTASTVHGTYTATSGAATSENGIPGSAAWAALAVGNDPTAPPNVTLPPSTTGATRPSGSSPDGLPLILLLCSILGVMAYRFAGERRTR